MDYNSIRDLIEKAKEIVGEKEYEEIRSKYKQRRRLVVCNV